MLLSFKEWKVGKLQPLQQTLRSSLLKSANVACFSVACVSGTSAMVAVRQTAVARSAGPPCAPATSSRMHSSQKPNLRSAGV